MLKMLILNDFYENLLQHGIIIPIVGAIVGTIVGIIIKIIYNKIKKRKTEPTYGRKGRKWK